jgi:hypothetical protein
MRYDASSRGNGASAVNGPRLVASGGLHRATTIRDARVWRNATREHANE